MMMVSGSSVMFSAKAGPPNKALVLQSYSVEYLQNFFKNDGLESDIVTFNNALPENEFTPTSDNPGLTLAKVDFKDGSEPIEVLQEQKETVGDFLTQVRNVLNQVRKNDATLN